MSKKAFFIILGLSVVVNEVAAIVDALFRNSFLAGENGVPLRFSSTSLFGGGYINYFIMTVDIVFWFVILYGFFRLFRRRKIKV